MRDKKIIRFNSSTPIVKAFLLLFLLFCLAFSVSAQEQTPTPSPSPEPEKIQGVPEIAPNYRKEDIKLPELGRVGVDLLEQKPLSLREAIEMALSNNKDIDIARDNVKIAEFDFRTSRGRPSAS